MSRLSKMEPPEELSLRLRKKIRTRQQIADAAAALFAARGYDAVTVADVARRAEVSEQTVYNLFSSKEQLVLDEDASFEGALIAMVRERGRGVSLADAVHAKAHAFLDELQRRPEVPEMRGGLPYLIQVSPTLRRAWLDATDRHASSLASVLVKDSAGTVSAEVAKVMAAAILAVFVVMIDEIGRAVNAGATRRSAIQRLRPEVDAAIARLAPALNSLQR
jgi:AcrR family transcriptional regulator